VLVYLVMRAKITPGDSEKLPLAFLATIKKK